MDTHMNTKIEISLNNGEVIIQNLSKRAFFLVMAYFTKAPQHGFSGGGENHYNVILPTICHGDSIMENPILHSVVPYQLDNLHLPHLIKLCHHCPRFVWKECKKPGADACGKCKTAKNDIADLRAVIAAAAKCPPSCKKINTGGCKGKCGVLSPVFRRIKERYRGL